MLRGTEWHSLWIKLIHHRPITWLNLTNSTSYCLAGNGISRKASPASLPWVSGKDWVHLKTVNLNSTVPRLDKGHWRLGESTAGSLPSCQPPWHPPLGAQVEVGRGDPWAFQSSPHEVVQREYTGGKPFASCRDYNQSSNTNGWSLAWHVWCHYISHSIFSWRKEERENEVCG